jgi:pilus assembly protein Flp/PilA
MFNYIKLNMQALTRDETGATLVEYGIAIVLAVGVGTIALLALTGAVSGSLNDTTAIM